MPQFSLAFYEKLFHSSGTAVMVMRQKDTVQWEPVWFSKPFCTMLETTSEELLSLEGFGMLDLIHPDDRQDLIRLVSTGSAPGGGRRVSLRHRTMKGHWLWVDVSCDFTEENGAACVAVTYTNADRQSKADTDSGRAFEAARREVRHIAQDAMSVYRMNLAKHHVQCLAGFSTWTDGNSRHDPDTLIRRCAACLPFPDDQTDFSEKFHPKALMKTFRLGNDAVTGVYYFKSPDGGYCFVRCTATVVREPSGGDVTAFFVVRECNAEVVRNTVLRDILSRQYDMVAWLSEDRYGVVAGKEEYTASGTGSFSDYIREHVLGHAASENDRAALAEALSTEKIHLALEKNDSYTVDAACIDNEEPFFKRFSFFPVRRGASFCVMMESDYTDIRREQDRRNRILETALSDARQAGVAKNAFLSRMSHEIRTPLNAVLGLTAVILREPELTEKIRSHLEKIDESGRCLLTLLENILNVSRIESGKVTLKEDAFSLASLLNDINGAVSGRCAAAGLAYQYSIEEDLQETYAGDLGKLEQILLNLLDNAVKFTSAPGSVHLRIERAGSGEGYDSLRFLVRDTGAGIPPELLDTIFDPFVQGDASNRNAYNGSGLGLTISRNMAELMNGTIRAESRRGQGSTFLLTVPLRRCMPIREESAKPAETSETFQPEAAELRKDRHAEDQAAGPAESAALAGKRILLAEDMLINAEIVTELLSMEGALTDHAENGAEAVDKMRASPCGYYQAVLMDIRMPVMDGLEAAAAIRRLAHPDAKKIPIIALTANALEEDVQRSIQAGMNAHLTKPVEPEQLLQTLVEWTEKKKTGELP